jgi:UDP-N-acetylglucosamine--N-acetylmuramyl-(pentapeptide) pyrophosphoryl-undecaprenol N-acetylglucosamine transferase
VFGGSQGAQFLNQIFPRAAELLEKQGVAFQVIHLTGKEGNASYGKKQFPLCVKPFEKEMGLAYLASDLAVCRSGAGTVAELIRSQIPAVLIPYPFAADDHQKVNGKYLAQTIGGARMLLQRETSAEKLASEITALAGELEIRKDALRKNGGKDEKRMGFADLVRSCTKTCFEREIR